MASARIEEFRKEAAIEQCVERWKKAKAELVKAQEHAEMAEKDLIAITDEQDYEGNGVRVNWVERKGPVDYKKVPELLNVDLGKYRKENTFYWKINLSHKG